MRKCADTPGCGGHLGKFVSCRDEALWDMSLDSAKEETGDSEFRGHFALVMLSQDAEHRMEDNTGRVVAIPAGFYVVCTHNSGAVSVHSYETEDQARAEMRYEGRSHAAWLSRVT